MSRERFKKYLVMKPEVNRIFDELDRYRRFCVEYGYAFNEAHLGNDHSPYADYMRFQQGKTPRDNWGWAIKQSRRWQENR
jgi:hypothetical protein